MRDTRVRMRRAICRQRFVTTTEELDQTPNHNTNGHDGGHHFTGREAKLWSMELRQYLSRKLGHQHIYLPLLFVGFDPSLPAIASLTSDAAPWPRENVEPCVDV